MVVALIMRYLKEKQAAFRARDPRARGGDRGRLGGSISALSSAVY